MRAPQLLMLPICLILSGSAAFAADPTPGPPPTNPPLTTIVTNDEGKSLVADTFSRALYVFDLDQDKPAPVCTGDCAEVWPPYILSADEAKDLAPPYGAIERANKKMQLTYGGRPVYTYAFDRNKGDDLGDGVENVWHYIEATPE